MGKIWTPKTDASKLEHTHANGGWRFAESSFTVLLKVCAACQPPGLVAWVPAQPRPNASRQGCQPQAVVCRPRLPTGLLTAGPAAGAWGWGGTSRHTPLSGRCATPHPHGESAARRVGGGKAARGSGGQACQAVQRPCWVRQSQATRRAGHGTAHAWQGRLSAKQSVPSMGQGCFAHRAAGRGGAVAVAAQLVAAGADGAGGGCSGGAAGWWGVSGLRS